MAFRVRIEKMIRPRIILVHAALHEPHAEHPSVKIQILLRRSGDRGDVMKTVDGMHRATIARAADGRYCK